MKRFRTLARLTFCSAALACAADPVEFSSGRTSVQYDSRLHQHLRWFGDRGRNVVAFDPAVQESIEVNGWECAEFVIDPRSVSTKRIEDREFGPALEGIVAGVSDMKAFVTFQSLPEVFRLIHDKLYELRPDPYLEVCICAMPSSP